MTDIKQAILEGIPNKLPPKKEFKTSISHAPKRKNIINDK